jgi:CheY-like chemotaxis protein
VRARYVAAGVLAYVLKPVGAELIDAIEQAVRRENMAS